MPKNVAKPVYQLMHRFKDAQQSIRIFGTHDWRLGPRMYREDYALSELRYRKQSNPLQDWMLWKVEESETKKAEEDLNDSLPDFLKGQPDNYAALIAEAADRQARKELLRKRLNEKVQQNG